MEVLRDTLSATTKPDETIIFVYTNTLSYNLPKVINPYIVIELIKHENEIHHGYHYAIFIENIAQLYIKLPLLRWNIRYNPYIYFYLIFDDSTPDKKIDIEKAFERMWKSDVYNIIIIKNQKVHVANPYISKKACFEHVMVELIKPNDLVKYLQYKNRENCNFIMGYILSNKELFMKSLNNKEGLLFFISHIFEEYLHLNVEYKFQDYKQEFIKYSRIDLQHKALKSKEIDAILLNLFHELFYEKLHVSKIVFYDTAYWCIAAPKRSINSKGFVTFPFMSLVLCVILSFLFTLLSRYVIIKTTNFFKVFYAALSFTVFRWPLYISEKCLSIAITYFMMLHLTLYNTYLNSIITVPFYEKSINNLQDLADSNTVTPVMYLISKLLLSTLDNKIAQKLAAKAYTDLHYSDMNLKYLTTHTNVSFPLYLSLLMSNNANKKLVKVIGKGFLGVLDSVFYMRMGHPLSKDFDKYIQRVNEAGLQKHWYKKLTSEHFSIDDNTDVPLSLVHFKYVFAILVVGFIAAFVTFLFEILVFKCCKRKTKKRAFVCDTCKNNIKI